MSDRKSAQPGRQVAVVVPHSRWPLSADEEISLRHLRAHLGRFDRYITGLQALPLELSDFKLRPFPARCFANRDAYNRLLMTTKFYRAFEDYEYILIYQFDALVFADNLEEWCNRGWDYVGAPWLKDPEQPEMGLSEVGNGGLSLRRVRSALGALCSTNRLEDPRTRGLETGPRSKIIRAKLRSRPQLDRVFVAGKTLLHKMGYHNTRRWAIRFARRSKRNEDYFWAYDAPRLLKEFRIPLPQEALKFSFEMAPRYCFEMNGRRLPFGCHAWARYDRKFWEPFLLK